MRNESSKESLTRQGQAVELVRRLGIARPRELARQGVSREYLGLLVRRGLVERIGRGLYSLPDADISEHHSLVEAAKRVPRGVVCLLSALRFHGLTTQAPSEVWLAIGIKARRPRVDYPPLRIVRFSDPALTSGMEAHSIEGVMVQVYSAAKTVADCFKYRNKIGLDVAIEGLRDCLRQRKATIDSLWASAKVCRVTNVIRPYLEAMA
ncbi:MAG TPA: type IV toxin-antitoxin system AbiEi family antitoxin domain-containing protein [Phycisphaerae bacterium]|nr:type IV toxin-antitoxin system AbiEi family antitoxin domain-containing protein [Phycisphaerae bacterium]HRY71496.1 type IV toxin-antitoxin system AbiEi family antitoxin domain-containing protein [Phycisphaerae bacterium]HSA29923.1 type IV toxin-antitoxin system AbiEi family antitoxin domain-containing protein [Phycisphaerae bacterium]